MRARIVIEKKLDRGTSIRNKEKISFGDGSRLEIRLFSESLPVSRNNRGSNYLLSDIKVANLQSATFKLFGITEYGEEGGGREEIISLRKYQSFPA